MTGTTNRYGIYEADHTKFGGIIYPSDFNTDYRGKDTLNGSYIAERILDDREFDRRCRMNRENNNKYNDWRKQKNA